MNPQTWETKSKSNPAQKPYVSELAADGKLLCNCKGWTTKKDGRARECTHTKKFAKDNGLVVEARGEFAYVVDTKEQPVYDNPMPLADLQAHYAHANAKPNRTPSFDPMLAVAMEPRLKGAAYDKAYTADVWAQEQKLDGYRVLVEKTDVGITAWSRPSAGEPANRSDLPPHIIAALKPLANGVYDGEKVVPGGKSWDVTRKGASLVLVLFDVLRLHDADATAYPYVDRRWLLLDQLAKLDPAQQAVTTVESLPPSWGAVEAFWKAGAEGVILKRLDSRYVEGRSDAWVKVKKLESACVTVVGFSAGKSGPHSTVDAVDDDGVAVRVKTLDTATRRAIAADPASFIGRKLWIEHQGRTPSGKYRHPMFDHWDK